MSRRAFAWFGLTLLVTAGAVAAPPSSAPEGSGLWRMFWGGVDSLNVVFKAIGTLGGGADAGEVWIVDLETGRRDRLGVRNDLSSPVLAADGATVFALQGRQLVRFTGSSPAATPVGPKAKWRKLIGVATDGGVLGLVAGTPRAHPALMAPDGRLAVLPQPSDDEDRKNVSLLLQENRAYADGRALLVKRSARGGRGFDVYLVAAGIERNLSDCGDDPCGQPSLTPDGRHVLYIRTTGNR